MAAPETLVAKRDPQPARGGLHVPIPTPIQSRQPLAPGGADVKLCTLPNGAPAQRLRHFTRRLHGLGPRMLHSVLDEALKGADALILLALLQRCAGLDPPLVKAIGGYELKPPVIDLTWTLRARLPPEKSQPSEREAP